MVVATYSATSSPSPVGVELDGIVYELFVSTLPSPAFEWSPFGYAIPVVRQIELRFFER